VPLPQLSVIAVTPGPNLERYGRERPCEGEGDEREGGRGEQAAGRAAKREGRQGNAERAGKQKHLSIFGGCKRVKAPGGQRTEARHCLGIFACG